MSQMRGMQSIELERNVYIMASASVAGQKEGDGPLGEKFDVVCQDPMFGQESWEKADLPPTQIRYIFAGDLLGQLIATSFGVENLDIPLFGLYGACSTCGESLSLGAMTVAGGYADYVMALTSSHFASAEKQFRFPLEYGNQRPLSAIWTVTGSAACQVIVQNLRDFERQSQDYDRIITGDLGYVSQKLLWDLVAEQGYDISQNHMDCGIEIFDQETQDTHAGGSGCGCSAVTLSAHILPFLEHGDWRRVLFLSTGALLSPTSFNEGQTIPGIAHGVVLEHCR